MTESFWPVCTEPWGSAGSPGWLHVAPRARKLPGRSGPSSNASSWPRSSLTFRSEDASGLRFEIWTRAVRLWAQDRYTANPKVWRELADLALQIRRARRYRPPSAAPAQPCADRALVDFFGGFFSGDGCLLLPKEGSARLVVKLRRDDRPLLETFAASFEMGSVIDTKPCGTASPTVVWTVTSRRDLLRAVALLDSAPLLGRKHDQYLAWRVGALEVVRAWLEARKPNPVVMDMARRALSASRAFTPATSPPPSGDRAAAGRAAYVEVLRLWAAGCEGRLTCMRYMDDRVRHPGWPNRNTITRVFGSWSAALHAAGLDG
jgi:hypothetical protein